MAFKFLWSRITCYVRLQCINAFLLPIDQVLFVYFELWCQIKVSVWMRVDLDVRFYVCVSLTWSSRSSAQLPEAPSVSPCTGCAPSARGPSLHVWTVVSASWPHRPAVERSTAPQSHTEQSSTTKHGSSEAAVSASGLQHFTASNMSLLKHCEKVKGLLSVAFSLKTVRA